MRRLLELERKSVLFAVSGFGVGYLPWCPGTYGTALAILPSLGLNLIASRSVWLAIIILALAIAGSIHLATRGAAILQLKDPQVIVIDEIVGFMVANFLAPPGFPTLVSAFVLFRFFDIAKIKPIARLEGLSGGAGIVLDDVMAGVYAFVILRLLIIWGIV